MKKEDIEQKLKLWTTNTKIGELEFDKIFQINGIPLWWFYQRFFVQHVLPKQINTFKFIINDQKLDNINRLKYNVSSIALRKYISISEKRKIEYFKNKKNTTEHSNKKNILFLSYTNHIQPNGKIFRVQKVINEVHESEELMEKIIFADPLSGKDYHKLDREKTIYEYYSPELKTIAQKTAQELHQKWIEINNKQKEEMLTIEDKSLWPYFKYALNLFFSKEFLYLVGLYYEIFLKILELEDIKVAVLSANNSLFEKCLIAAAAKKNIPTIIIQHGVGIDQVDPTLIGKTKLAVFGEYFLHNLVQSHQVNPQAIDVVGPLVFEGIEKFKISQIKKNKKTETKKVLLVTSAMVEDGDLSEDDYFKKLTVIFQKLAPIKNLYLTLKLHPREGYMNRYREMMAFHKINGEIVREMSREEFYKLIQECDSFINFGSTAALEAMIIGKPIVTIDMFDGKWTYSDIIVKSNATINVKYDGDIQKNVEESFKDKPKLKKKREEFVRKLCFKVDGKEAKRIKKLIKKLIN